MSERTWPNRVTGLGILASAIAVVFILISGPGYRFGLVPLKAAFMIGMAAALIAMFAVLMLVIGLLARGTAGRTARAFVALIAAGGISAMLLNVYVTSKRVPPIHDISTDTADPPQFDALLGARANAANPPEYAGPETAAQQAEAYPDIETLRFEGVDAARTLEAAEAAARAIGREGVVAQPGKNLVEGTDVTFWYGYKDDVVVRVRESGTGSIVDIRSKSRVGVSDLGANARRVRALSAEIRRQLGAEAQAAG